jgi:galactokinase
VILASAPGRVNLIGDHTDYTGGLVLPIAIDLGTEVTWLPDAGREVRLTSGADHRPVVFPCDVREPSSFGAGWGRYVAGVIAAIGPVAGGRGRVETTLPLGAGLASSASLEVALALAFGFEGEALDLALACQRAEHIAAGVPCGIMDQLAVAAGQAGHAILIDCASFDVQAVPIPASAEIVVVHSGEARKLIGSGYADRREQCERAETIIGPLRSATLGEVEQIPDPVLRRRAHHVVSENARVRACAAALRAGDVRSAGALLDASHASLRDDFEVSTPALDALVNRLRAAPGVHGARLTGAGFGGCAVALCDPGAGAAAAPGSVVVHAVEGARRAPGAALRAGRATGPSSPRTPNR